MAAGLAEHERLNQEIAAQSSSSANEVRDLQQRCCSLAQELAAKESSMETARQCASEQAENFKAETLQLRGLLQEAEACFLIFAHTFSIKISLARRSDA